MCAIIRRLDIRITELDGDIQGFYKTRSVRYLIHVMFERRIPTFLIRRGTLVFYAARDTGNPSGVGARYVQHE